MINENIEPLTNLFGDFCPSSGISLSKAGVKHIRRTQSGQAWSEWGNSKFFSIKPLNDSAYSETITVVGLESTFFDKALAGPNYSF